MKIQLHTVYEHIALFNTAPPSFWIYYDLVSKQTHFTYAYCVSKVSISRKAFSDLPTNGVSKFIYHNVLHNEQETHPD